MQTNKEMNKRVTISNETHQVLKIISAFLGKSMNKTLEIIVKEYSNRLKNEKSN